MQRLGLEILVFLASILHLCSRDRTSSFIALSSPLPLMSTVSCDTQNRIFSHLNCSQLVHQKAVEEGSIIPHR